MTRLPSTSKGPRLVYLMGAEARMAVNDEPEFSEAELLAADRARSADKHAASDDDALELQVRMFRNLGVM